MRMRLVFVAAALCGVLREWSVLPAKALGDTEARNCAIVVAGSVSGASNVTNVCGIPPELLRAIVEELTKSNKVLQDLAEERLQAVQRIQQALELTNGQISAAFALLGEKHVPPEQLATRLVKIAQTFKDRQSTDQGDQNRCMGSGTIVCDGVDPRAMKTLNELLDQKDLELGKKIQEANDWARRYRTLETQLAELGASSELAREAGAALSRGEIVAAGTLLDQLITRQKAQLERQQAQLAKSYASRAQVFNLQLNYQSAWEYYLKALRYQPDDPALLNEAGLLAYEWEKYDDAEPLFKRAVVSSEKSLGSDSPDLANSLNNLAGLYQKTGRYTDAEPLYKRAIALGDKTLGPEHPTQAIRLNNLGSLYRILRRYDDAEKLYLRAIAIGETLGPEHPDQAVRLNNLGELYLGAGRFAEAEAPLRRAIEIDKSLGPDNVDLVNPLNNLGQLCWATYRYAEAEALYRRAIAVGEKAQSGKPIGLAKTRRNYADLLDKLGRTGEAAKLRALAAAAPQ